MGPYITEAGTPVADMWERLYGKEDKKEHMKRMFDLTTRMNALARITLVSHLMGASYSFAASHSLSAHLACLRL